MRFYLSAKPMAACFLFAALGLSGCGSDGDINVLTDDPAESNEPSPIADNVDIVACPESSSQSDYEDGFTRLINDQHEFRERYLGSLPNQQSEPPEVDFNEKSVIAVHAGVLSSTNQRVRITEVEQSGDAIDVTYQVVVPCDSDTNSLTHPFCFVAVDKHEGPISFTEADEACTDQAGSD